VAKIIICNSHVYFGVRADLATCYLLS